MSVLLVVFGAVALVLPGLRPALALRARPQWVAPLDAIALLVGLVSLLAGLLLSFSAGVLHVAAGSSLLWFDGHLAPGGLPASVLSGVVLALLAKRMVFAGVRSHNGRRHARAERWLGHHERFDDLDLVVLPTDRPLAYSVTGSPPQVVISEGLRASLDRELVEFVVEHERVHLRRKHRRHLIVALLTECAVGRFSTVGRSILALRMAVERAADEEAAGQEPQRRRQLGVALAAMAGHRLLPRSTREALSYRAGELSATPASNHALFEIIATAGLVALTLAAASVVAHASGDVTPLLAALSG